MAKKAIGKVKSGVRNSVAKLIIPIKSPKTGAYIFQKKVMPVEEVKKFLAENPTL